MGGAAAGMGVGVVHVSVVELFAGKEMLSIHPTTYPLATSVTAMAW